MNSVMFCVLKVCPPTPSFFLKFFFPPPNAPPIRSRAPWFPIDPVPDYFCFSFFLASHDYDFPCFSFTSSHGFKFEAFSLSLRASVDVARRGRRGSCLSFDSTNTSPRRFAMAFSVQNLKLPFYLQLSGPREHFALYRAPLKPPPPSSCVGFCFPATLSDSISHTGQLFSPNSPGCFFFVFPPLFCIAFSFYLDLLLFQRGFSFRVTDPRTGIALVGRGI